MVLACHKMCTNTTGTANIFSLYLFSPVLVTGAVVLFINLVNVEDDDIGAIPDELYFGIIFRSHRHHVWTVNG